MSAAVQNIDKPPLGAQMSITTGAPEAARAALHELLSKTLEGAVGKVRPETVQLVKTKSELLVDLELVTADILGSISEEQLINWGISPGVAAALKLMFPLETGGVQQVGWHDGRWVSNRKLAELERQLALLRDTTTSYGQLGGRYQEGQRVVQSQDLPFEHVYEGDEKLTNAVDAVLRLFPHVKSAGVFYQRPPRGKRARSTAVAEMESDDDDDDDNAGAQLMQPNQLHGMSLADILIDKLSSLRKDTHMQPVIIKIMSAIAKAVNSDMHVTDTHSTSCQFYHPPARPDFVFMAYSMDQPAWTQVVVVGEAKKTNGQNEVNVMIGQLGSRSAAAIDQQPLRTRIYGIGLTMNSIQVVSFGRPTSDSPMSMSTIGAVPFSISVKSPGFRLLASLLNTPKHNLGMRPQTQPGFQKLGDREFSAPKLLRLGSATGSRTDPSGGKSYVYSVISQGAECILKLNISARETNLLKRVKGVPFVVELLGADTCIFEDRQWYGVLLHPKVRLLSNGDSVKVIAQVVRDVAAAISACAQKGVRQRDVTWFNIGVDESGRGCLFDFASGKVIADESQDEQSPTGKPQHISGTMRYTAYSVLVGKQHSVSSDLEGLFISVDAISRGIHSRHPITGTTPDAWQSHHLGAFKALCLQDEHAVVHHLRPLVKDLHEVFWPLVKGALFRTYRMDVTAKEVQEVCDKYIG